MSSGADVIKLIKDKVAPRLPDHVGLGFEVEGRVADAESIPYDDDSFDLVVGHAVLHHIPDVEQALREVLRVLRINSVIRTAHKMGIETVAVYSDADEGALFTKYADEAFHIGPAPAAESYLNITFYRCVVWGNEPNNCPV